MHDFSIPCLVNKVFNLTEFAAALGDTRKYDKYLSIN